MFCFLQLFVLLYQYLYKILFCCFRGDGRDVIDAQDYRQRTQSYDRLADTFCLDDICAMVVVAARTRTRTRTRRVPIVYPTVTVTGTTRERKRTSVTATGSTATAAIRATNKVGQSTANQAKVQCS